MTPASKYMVKMAEAPKNSFLSSSLLRSSKFIIYFKIIIIMSTIKHIIISQLLLAVKFIAYVQSKNKLVSNFITQFQHLFKRRVQIMRSICDASQQKQELLKYNDFILGLISFLGNILDIQQVVLNNLQMSSNIIRNQDYTSIDFLQQLFPSSNNVSSQSSNKALSFGQIHHHNSERHKFLHSSSSDLGHIKLGRTHSLVDSSQSRPLNNFKMFYDVLVKGLYDKEESQTLWKKFEASTNSSYQLEHFLWDFNKKKDNQLVETKRKQQQKAILTKNRVKMEVQLQNKQKEEIRQIRTKQQKQNKQEPRKINKKIVRSNSHKNVVKQQNRDNQKVEIQLRTKNKSNAQRQIKETKNRQNQRNTKENNCTYKKSRSLQSKDYKKEDIKALIKKQFGYIRRIIQHGEKFIHS